jgi:hypothetical protein
MNVRDLRYCKLVPMCLGIVFPLQVQATAEQTQATDAEVASQIDWNSLPTLSPIPASMPARSSDDPLEVGFAPQWIKRVVTPGMDESLKSRVIKMATLRRDPNDMWALDMERALRQLVHDKVSDTRSSRVFCNSSGCLCYVERNVQFLANPIIFTELKGKEGRELGIRQEDLWFVTHAVRTNGIPWELTVVTKPRQENLGK